MERGNLIEIDVENPVVTGEGLPEDPQAIEVLLSCDLCHREIYEGDAYFFYSGDIFCSTHHLGEHLLKHGLAESRIATRNMPH